MIFSASTEDIFGMGNSASSLAQVERDATILARKPGGIEFNYRGSGGYTSPGIIELVGIDKAVAEFGELMGLRISSRSSGLDYLAYELKRAAWRYSSQDRATADQLADAHSRIDGNLGGYTAYSVDPMASATQFPAGETPDLAMPEHRETDVRAIIDQSNGILTELDQNVRYGTQQVHKVVPALFTDEGWSPLEQIVAPLVGNWEELERAGECFQKAGTASEVAAETFKSGNAQLSRSWQGSAADAYQDYGLKLSNAMAWEGPIGRIAEAVLTATSEQAQAAASELLTYVNKKFQEEIIDKGIKKVLEKAVTSFIPGVGWLYTAVTTGKDMYDMGMALWNIYQEAEAMLDKIRTLVKDAQAVLDALENPQEAAANELNQRIDKVKGQIESATEKIELATDIAAAADITAVTNAPKENYIAPTGAPAWENS
jgi:uncharacterized protein YukE